MAITVNGAVLRNMPEQISKNVEDIADHEDRLSTIENGIAGNLALNDVTVSNDATINDLTVIGDTVLGNDASDTLNVTGAVDIAGDTEITGATTINGNTNVNGNFDVSGTANIGMLTFEDANINGDMYVAGNFTCAGTVAMGTFTFTNANIAGNMSIAGDLGVTGAATLSSTLGVTGTVTASSDVIVGDDISVVDDATIGGNLTVTGAATLSSTLGVSGDVTASSDVGVGGDLTVTGSIGPLENIVDSNGNKRFVTNDVTGMSALVGSGAAIDYAKWSLVGSHLMIVLQIYNPTASTINIASYSGMAYTEGMASWLLNKVVPLQSGVNSVTYKTFKGLDTTFTESSNELGAYLAKGADRLYINSWNNTSLEAGFHYRIQFDLIID